MGDWVGRLMKHSVYCTVMTGLKLSVLVFLSLSLASCGVSQLTEPLQRGLFGSDEKQNENADNAQSAGAAGGERNQLGGFTTKLASTSMGCPVIEIDPDTRTVSYTAPGSGNDPQAVMHRGEIVEVARECGTSANGITVKYGLSGRVLLGPRGKPGSITLPVQLKIVDRTNVVIKKQDIRVVVNIPAGETAGVFSQVSNVDIPVPVGATAKNYKLFIGFATAQSSG